MMRRLQARVTEEKEEEEEEAEEEEESGNSHTPARSSRCLITGLSGDKAPKNCCF